MAKLSLINREKKRAKTAAKYAKRRVALLEVINNSQLPDEQRKEARMNFQALPRNSSPSRQRNRCVLTGRPRGVFRKFGLCRNKLREMAMRGEVPGMIKASW